MVMRLLSETSASEGVLEVVWMMVNIVDQNVW